MAILNQRGYRLARARLASLRDALSTEASMAALAAAANADLAHAKRKALQAEYQQLKSEVAAYEGLLESPPAPQKQIEFADTGTLAIIARIRSRLSQKELGDRLGMKEQQIQRYEADRYQGASLATFLRVLDALNVSLAASFDNPVPFEKHYEAVDPAVEKEVRRRGWLNPGDDLAAFIDRSLALSSAPALHRRTVGFKFVSSDHALLAWQAQALKRAAETVVRKIKFDFLDSAWLNDFVKLSRHGDGPRQAKSFLETKGIILIVEPHLSHTHLDGAAMVLRSGNPVVGLTLRHDRIDNFWFTLLHEIGHIYLHFHKGLAEGFLDTDVDGPPLNEIEKEANEFALSALVDSEIWNTSIARFSRSADEIVSFAHQLEIHPAIVAGRIRHERNDYKIFSKLVGQGEVRQLFGDTRS